MSMSDRGGMGMFATQHPQAMPAASVTAEELLDAANEASGQSRNMWIAFIALLAYLIVTIAGTTHKDLLLNNPVMLPFLQVEIPLFAFFIYGPLVILVMHLGVLIQHAMLAFKLFRVTELMQDGGWHRTGNDPRRSKLHAYIFAQLIAGPDRGRLMGFLMRLMTWFSLIALPVFALLFFQVAFLPFHDVTATYWHRVAVLLDCMMLFSLGPYMRAATKREAKARVHSAIGEFSWPWRVTIIGFGLGSIATVSIVLFSWFVATIPDSCAYKKGEVEILCLDKTMAKFKPWAVKIKSGNTERDVFWLTAILFEGSVDPVTGKPTSLWSRNIVMTDIDLVPEKKFNKGEVSLSLRGRDLRYAVLDRTDLHRADFTGVDLRGASLKETRLEEARFCLPLRVSPRQCSEFSGADMKEANLRGVDFWGANLDGAQLAFVHLEGADFRNAQLEGANLSFADLKGADLSLANLTGAKFSYANMQLTNFSEAQLAEAQFNGAKLQGANLAKAQLEGANLAAANLQGAQMTSTKLQGANLKEAKLEGTDLRMSDMRGANLEDATLMGSDLRYVRLWGTTAPASGKELALARTAGISYKALDEDEVEELTDTVDAISDKELRARLTIKLAKAGLLDAKGEAKWDGQGKWESAIQTLGTDDPTINAKALEGFWAKLACGQTDIAQSLAKRLAKGGYFTDRAGLARRMTVRTCDAAIAFKEETRFELCNMASWQVDDLKNTICR